MKQRYLNFISNGNEIFLNVAYIESVIHTITGTVIHMTGGGADNFYKVSGDECAAFKEIWERYMSECP